VTGRADRAGTRGRLDRVRPRDLAAMGTAPSLAPVDTEGKRTLFSAADADSIPAAGSVVVDCSGCSSRTVLTPLRAARVLLPSLHLPLLRRGHPSLLRCPACRRISWVRLHVQL
jgi:predicted short-subunit dehydrogenase-like oxidoreductase (DUF2520 family)